MIPRTKQEGRKMEIEIRRLEQLALIHSPNRVENILWPLAAGNIIQLTCVIWPASADRLCLNPFGWQKTWVKSLTFLLRQSPVGESPLGTQEKWWSYHINQFMCCDKHICDATRSYFSVLFVPMERSCPIPTNTYFVSTKSLPEVSPTTCKNALRLNGHICRKSPSLKRKTETAERSQHPQSECMTAVTCPKIHGD